jgi:hypothetical protein
LPVYIRGQDNVGPPLDNERWAWWRLIRKSHKVRRLTENTSLFVAIDKARSEDVQGTWKVGLVASVTGVNESSFNVGPFDIGPVTSPESWQDESSLGVDWELVDEGI